LIPARQKTSSALQPVSCVVSIKSAWNPYCANRLVKSFFSIYGTVLGISTCGPTVKAKEPKNVQANLVHLLLVAYLVSRITSLWLDGCSPNFLL
jgi:hypothetical protein